MRQRNNYSKLQITLESNLIIMALHVNQKYVQNKGQKFIKKELSLKLKTFQNLILHQIFGGEWQNKPLKKIISNNIINSFQIQYKFKKLKQKYEQNLKSSRNLQSQIIFRQIARKISGKMEYNVYLPSIMKVIISNINWIDKDDDLASIGLKVELKVNVPGISQYPHLYESVFKNKMKLTFKTKNKSYVYNESVNFRQKNTQDKCFFMMNEKLVQNKSNSSEFNTNAKNFYQQKYKWKNYNQPNYIFKKTIEDFQGFILQAKMYDIKALIKGKTILSPIQVLDLYGIIEVESIETSMKDWIQILLPRDDKSDLKNFLLYACPKVTLKFNLISLYEDFNNVKRNKSIYHNHIRSFDDVQYNDYNLAQNLMFLQVTNNRKSKYELRKFRACKSSQQWFRKKHKNKKYSGTTHQAFQNNLSNKKIIQEMQNFYKQLNRLNRFPSTQIELHQLSQVFNFDAYALEDAIFQRYLMLSNPQKYKIFKQHQINLQKLQFLFEKEQKNLIINIQKQYHQNHNQQDLDSTQLNSKISQFQIKKYQFENYYKKCLQLIIYDFRKNKYKGSKITQKQQQQIDQYKIKLRKLLQNSQKNKNMNQNQKTDQSYHNSKVIFHFPIYRNPSQSLCIIFVPILFLCIINLVIFFQQNGLNDRLASTTSLMICFIGMLVILQQEIKSEVLSLFQVIVYIMMSTPIICLFFSLNLYHQHEKVKEPDQIRDLVLKSSLFWICVAITILGGLIPTALYAFYKLGQEKQYKKNINHQKKLQPLQLLIPGSEEVSQIVKRQLKLKQAEESQNNQFNEQKISLLNKQSLKKKQLQDIILNLLLNHVLSLYQMKRNTSLKLYNDQIEERIQKALKDTSKRKLLKHIFQKEGYVNNQKQDKYQLFIFN